VDPGTEPFGAIKLVEFIVHQYKYFLSNIFSLLILAYQAIYYMKDGVLITIYQLFKSCRISTQNTISEHFVAQQNKPTPRTRSSINTQGFYIAYIRRREKGMAKGLLMV
jgi:hypothetical protein